MKFLTYIDLTKNEIRNAVLQQLASAPGTPVKGLMYYNTTDDHPYIYNGSAWVALDNTGGASGESNTASNQGGQSVELFYQKSGVDLQFKTLSIGTGLTANDMTTYYVIAANINDAGNGASELWSAQKVENAIAQAVAGLVDYKGGYNASTNSPDLDTSPSGILKGDAYTVTTAGNFFTEAVQPGDMLIAEIDNPTVLADWTLVNKNISDIVDASESQKGIIEIATQTEANTGEDDTRALTPKKAKTALPSWGAMRRFTKTLTSGSATYTVTHNFNTKYVQVEVYDATNDETVIVDIDRTTVNAVEIRFASNTSNDFVAIVMG